MDIFEKLKKLSNEYNTENLSQKPQFLIVGLGNPGIQYENTRHNAGFMAMQAAEKKYGVSINIHKFKGLTAVGKIREKSCLFLKPETYMNLSGDSVSLAANFYKIPVENIIVIFDDISLEPGNIRIKRKGSSGGHNGIKSIIEQLDSQDFPRIKIGIGKKPNEKYDLADWVLSKFSQDELKKLDSIWDNVCQSLELIVEGEISQAMNKFN